MATITAEDLKKKFETPGEVYYDELVRMACGDILVEETMGDGWSGDGHFLVKSGNEYAHVVLGYGSCSHCDAVQYCLEDENPYDKLADLANDIAMRVMWKTKDEMLAYLKEHDAKGAWYGERDWKEFSAAAMKAFEEN